MAWTPKSEVRIPRPELGGMEYTMMCVACGLSWQRRASRGNKKADHRFCPQCAVPVREDLNGWMRAAIYRAAIVEAQLRLLHNDREGALRALTAVGH